MRAKDQIDNPEPVLPWMAPAPLPFESTLGFAFRSCGGKETAIAGARLVPDPRFERLVWAYDNATETDKRNLVLEDLCSMADIQPDEFLGLVIQAMWKRSIDIGRLTAVAAHPRIVEATIDIAQTGDGSAERKFLLDHAGFLPRPQGQIINVDARVQIPSAADKGLPSFEEEGKVIDIAVRKQLPPADEPEKVS